MATHNDNADLRTAFDVVVAENQALRRENEALRTRLAEVEARLGQNSKNSSKPPSSDGYGKPPAATRRTPSGRRPGKQPGSPGAHLAKVALPDEIVVHAPMHCGSCQAPLEEAEVTRTETRQVFDLPPIRLLATEHQVQHRLCRCGTTTVGSFPVGVSSPTQYGPGVYALATYLGAYQHLPIDRTAQMLSDCFGASVAAGTLIATQAECATRLTGFTDRVREQVAASPVAHFDETGARVAGKLQWVHSASTSDLTLYTVHQRRGIEAMEAAGVLPWFTGVAVHDGWTSYRRYGADHGLCNAHHLRELAGAAEQTGQGWAGDMATLLVEIKEAVDSAKRSGRLGLGSMTLARFERRYDALLVAGQLANPATPVAGGRRVRARSKPANLLGRLQTHRQDVLRFATDFRVPFDNNQAERDLRMVKLQQKVSGCWRSPQGASNFCTIRSYISTARKQGANVLDVLRRVFLGDPWLSRSAAVP